MARRTSCLTQRKRVNKLGGDPFSTKVPTRPRRVRHLKVRHLKGLDPAPALSAAERSSLYDGEPNSVRNHPVIAPDVAIPPARLWAPWKAPTVPQSPGAVILSALVLMRNMVEPYMSMRSPGFCAPTLTASLQASIVSVITGIPAVKPVRAAASAVTYPAMSEGQRRGGIRTSGQIAVTQGSYQSWLIVSYRGVHWLAE